MKHATIPKQTMAIAIIFLIVWTAYAQARNSLPIRTDEGVRILCVQF